MEGRERGATGKERRVTDTGRERRKRSVGTSSLMFVVHALQGKTRKAFFC